MIIRFLVLIFALNAFAPPAMAIPCEMMNHDDMSSMTHAGHDISSHKMSEKNMDDHEKNCHMDLNHSCMSLECLAACTICLPLLTIDNYKNFSNKIISDHPKENLEPLYQIILAISTPPPLV